MTLLVHIRHLVGAGLPVPHRHPLPHPDGLSRGLHLSAVRGGDRPVDYRDTEHYRLTRRFLEAPERMMELLFQEL